MSGVSPAAAASSWRRSPAAVLLGRLQVSRAPGTAARGDPGGRCQLAPMLDDHPCERDAEFILVVNDKESRACGRCYKVTIAFLIDHGVPATSVTTARLATTPKQHNHECACCAQLGPQGTDSSD